MKEENYIELKATYDGTVLYEKGDFSITEWMSSDYAALPSALRPEKKSKVKFAVKGYNVPLLQGVEYSMSGKWTTGKNSQYTFQAREFYPIEPTESKARIAYLSSGLIRGVSERIAINIDAKFGDDTFRVLAEAPDLLLNIPEITTGRLQMILESYAKPRFAMQLKKLFGKENLSSYMIEKIRRKMGDDAAEKIKKDPYLMTTVVEMDFAICDSVAINMGMDLYGKQRFTAALTDIFRKARKRGHMFLYKKYAASETATLLNRNIPEGKERFLINTCIEKIDELIQDGILTEADHDRLYLTSYYKVEYETAKKLVQMKKSIYEYDKQKYSAALKEYIDGAKFKPAQKQTEAIIWGLVSRVMILTGGPGTGKTTTINGIIKIYKKVQPKKEVFVLAPTGRAARRASEATGEDAMTIDKLLVMLGSGEYPELLKELVNGLIICDEMSMVDAWKIHDLVKYLTPQSHLILVGDPNQLPSVDAGDVLRQLIMCKAFRTVHLDCIYRQGADSPIIVNANKIMAGDCNLLFNDKFNFIDVENVDQCVDSMEKLYMEAIRRLGVENVALLTPCRKKSEIGCERMNERIKKMVGTAVSGTKCVHVNGQDFHIGDRVMENQNSDRSSNGDVGVITDIRMVEENGRTVTKIFIRFDGYDQDIAYLKEEMDNISYGWSYTIHKSQGSEYKYVISPLMSCDSGMLRRNLFYTMITRAKEKVTLIGSRKMLKIALEQIDTGKRNTMLGEMCRNLKK